MFKASYDIGRNCIRSFYKLFTPKGKRYSKLGHFFTSSFASLVQNDVHDLLLHAAHTTGSAYLNDCPRPQIKCYPVSWMLVVSIQKIKGLHLFCFTALFSAKRRLSVTKPTKWLNREQNEWQNLFRGSPCACFSHGCVVFFRFSMLLVPH